MFSRSQSKAKKDVEIDNMSCRILCFVANLKGLDYLLDIVITSRTDSNVQIKCRREFFWQSGMMEQKKFVAIRRDFESNLLAMV